MQPNNYISGYIHVKNLERYLYNDSNSGIFTTTKMIKQLQYPPVDKQVSKTNGVSAQCTIIQP